MTREDILLHVVTHGTYHRGHVAGMMRHASHVPPITDYPVSLKSLRRQSDPAAMRVVIP